MSLSRTLDIADSGLRSSAQQSAVYARNIAQVNDAGSSRKIVNLSSQAGIGVRVSSIVRAPDEGLREAVLGARSDVGAQKAISAGLTTLAQTVGDPEVENSPSALLAKLSGALQLFASAPQSLASGRAAIAAAAEITAGLNAASQTVASVRQKADGDIATAVEKLNSLMPTFQTINDQIVQNTVFGVDVTDLEDQRDNLLKLISDEIGVRTSVRANNDMVIQTDSGVMLFERRARAVVFEPSPNLAPGQSSNSVYIDGVPVTLEMGGMPIVGGRIAGASELANKIAPVYSAQLDEIARGLVLIFSESDQSASPSLPDVAGLFTYQGATPPLDASLFNSGLAAKIVVNENADPEKGGDVARLRDGGIGSPGVAAYVYNSDGGAGFSDRLQGLIKMINEPQAFHSAAGLSNHSSLSTFTSDSAAWLEAKRKSATSAVEYKSIVLERSATNLSNVAGINLDREVTNMLDIERSYQASAKVLSVVNEMLDTLIGSIR